MKRKVLSFLIFILLSSILTGCIGSFQPDEAISGFLSASTVTMPVLASPHPTRTSTLTLTPYLSPVPTETSAATLTPIPVYSPTPFFVDVSLYPESKTDKIEIESDMTIPDGTILKPNQMFVKSWRVINSGNNIWNESYRIVSAYSNPFKTPQMTKAIFLQPTSLIDFSVSTWNSRQHNVMKGSEVDIAIPLQAPSEPGSYTADYFLINEKNEKVTPHFWANFIVQLDEKFETQTAAATISETPLPKGTEKPTETPDLTLTAVSEEYNWTGTWMIRDPSVESPDIPVEAWMTQNDRDMSGFYYDSDGEPVLFTGTLSQDKRIFKGEFAYPWMNRAVSVEWRMLVNQNQFYSVTKDGVVGLGSSCGGRNGMGFPDSCSLPNGD